jgi:hypothetical protein
MANGLLGGRQTGLSFGFKADGVLVGVVMAVGGHILGKGTEIVAHAQHRVLIIQSEFATLELRKVAIEAEL